MVSECAEVHIEYACSGLPASALMQHRLGLPAVSCVVRSLKKEAKLKEKKGKAWKQRQGEQKQAQAKKQKKYDCFMCELFLQSRLCWLQAANAQQDPIHPAYHVAHLVLFGIKHCVCHLSAAQCATKPV